MDANLYSRRVPRLTSLPTTSPRFAKPFDPSQPVINSPEAIACFSFFFKKLLRGRSKQSPVMLQRRLSLGMAGSAPFASRRCRHCQPLGNATPLGLVNKKGEGVGERQAEEGCNTGKQEGTASWVARQERCAEAYLKATGPSFCSNQPSSFSCSDDQIQFRPPTPAFFLQPQSDCFLVRCPISGESGVFGRLPCCQAGARSVWPSAAVALGGDGSDSRPLGCLLLVGPTRFLLLC